MYIIAGLYRHHLLSTPKSGKTRPTASRLRETVFNICQNYIEGAHFLDLFAGSGAMGLEALSRGAQSATFIDQHKEAIQCIQHNVSALKVKEQTQVLCGDVFQVLNRLKEKGKEFDIIYVDPPYKTPFPSSELEPIVYYSEKVIRWLDEQKLLAPNGTLFIEEAVEAESLIGDLKTLKLKNSRKAGSTVLQQYIYQS